MIIVVLDDGETYGPACGALVVDVPDGEPEAIERALREGDFNVLAELGKY